MVNEYVRKLNLWRQFPYTNNKIQMDFSAAVRRIESNYETYNFVIYFTGTILHIYNPKLLLFSGNPLIMMYEI